MKKIKITEKQAELLGLNKITEKDENGLSANTVLDGVIARVVISGEDVPRFKDRIIQIVMKHDKNARVGFFEQTGKIVGNIREIKLDVIKRDIKNIDKTISIEKKPITKSLKESSKNIIKLSKEQYDRLLTFVNENEIKGGLNRVDKIFKKEFTGKNTQNLSEIEKTDKSEDQVKKETPELIKYLYRKSEKLSPFWKQNGMDYDSICNTLLAKNMIVKHDDKYELAKTLGDPKSAIQAIEDELRKHIKPQITEPELETEESNYPVGSENDINATWNEKDQDVTKQNKPKEAQLSPIAFNNEVALLKGPDGSMYVFYYDSTDKKEFMQYASVPRNYIGKDEDGQPEYDYDYDSAEIDGDVISHYVNDNINVLSKGEGLEDYENGVDLVKIDEPLKQELSKLYDKDQKFVKNLNNIDEEANYPKLMNQFRDNMDRESIKHPSTETPEAKQSRIIAKLAQLKAKELERQRIESGDIEEMTGTGSAGAFTGPLNGDIVKRETTETPVVGETTVASAGNFQYDTPGLANVGPNGEFNSGPKTKAEKITQWAGGSFVKQPECSKPNNNKSAENGGCNSGASSLKMVKSGGSINAPSLGENIIYETIAKKTGKTIDEVKKIIESKK